MTRTTSQLLIAAEVAQLLRVDLKTVRRMTRTKTLPAFNVGTGRTPRWRYDAADIERWLDQRRTTS